MKTLPYAALVLASLLPLASRAEGAFAISNHHIRVTLEPKCGAFLVTDYRTDRTWTYSHAGPKTSAARDVRVNGKTLTFEVTSGDMPLCVRAELEEDAPEFTVELAGDGPMTQDLTYPHPFASQKGDRLVVPMNEGMLFPVEGNEPDGGKGGKGLPLFTGVASMPFYGLMRDADGSGLMTIVEARDDAVINFHRTVDGNLLTAKVLWKTQKGQFGYPRRLRIVALGGGGYVAMAKRFRVWAKANGRFKPFSEKVKERPLVDRLLGAVNFWFWRGDAMKMIDCLDSCGIDRVLWSAQTTPEATRRLAVRPNTLVGKYDIYTDVYYPELEKALGRGDKPGLNGEAWPQDIVWTKPDSNAWMRAWAPKLKDGTFMPTARMCDRQAPKYVRARIKAEIRERPYNARFIDVTATSGDVQCYNPSHPMTRTDDRLANRKILDVVGREFGMVVGSENGSDAFVDVADYFEGMLSICRYRVPQSGRDVERIWPKAPENVVRYQVGEEYRIPLWELVYHDCVCAHWYWGDYTNKLPELWNKRDLFNVLYGTMPMFMVTGVEAFEKDRDRFVRSYNRTSPVARATGYSEMLDHRFMTADRRVQRTRFANGTVVTVNFGSTPWRAEDGVAVEAGDYRVTQDVALSGPRDAPADNWARYVRQFNADDDELYANAIPNTAAEAFLRANAPAFECSDAEIERAYHFRWWTYRKHIRQTPEGWVVTEFLPDVGWAGKYNTINCPAVHHFLEGRWLRDPKYLNDYARFWVVGSGTSAGTRAYVFGPAWAYWERAKVTGDRKFVEGLYDALVAKHAQWVEGWITPCYGGKKGEKLRQGGSYPNGMFATTDNYEGSEYSLSGHGYRPWINSAMWGEKATLAKLARALGKGDDAARYSAEADALAAKIRSELWNPKLNFFVTRSLDDRLSDVRELAGFSPWYYGVNVAGCDRAWESLMGFAAKWGLTYPSLDAKGFDIAYVGHECLWNGPVWPYATSVALTGYIRWSGRRPQVFTDLLHRYAASMVCRLDDGRVVSWIDEDQNPYTGDWIARTRIRTTPRMRKAFKPERGKDYNHSTFCDLVISGYVGLTPCEDGRVVVRPLADNADYFRLSNVRYQGRELDIRYDRTGTRYGEKGLVVYENGRRVGTDR